jgi:hypothetical protein
VIEREAERAGRRIDPEHFGVTLTYQDGEIPQLLLDAVARRRPGVDPSALIPKGLDGCARRIEEFVEAGISKFIVRPGGPAGASPHASLEAMADALLPLQT